MRISRKEVIRQLKREKKKKKTEDDASSILARMQRRFRQRHDSLMPPRPPSLLAEEERFPTHTVVVVHGRITPLEDRTLAITTPRPRRPLRRPLPSPPAATPVPRDATAPPGKTLHLTITDRPLTVVAMTRTTCEKPWTVLALARRTVIVTSDRDGTTLYRLPLPATPPPTHPVPLAQLTALAHEPRRLRLARALIAAAVENASTVAARQEQPEIATRLKEGVAEVLAATSIRELFHREAHLKHQFYQLYERLGVPTWLLGGTRRFVRRYHPPSSPLNAMISVLNMALYRVVLTLGLSTPVDPRIPLLHGHVSPRRHRHRPYTLHLDIAEVFRPVVVDRIIMDLLTASHDDAPLVQPRHFYHDEIQNAWYCSPELMAFLTELLHHVVFWIHLKRTSSSSSSWSRSAETDADNADNADHEWHEYRVISSGAPYRIEHDAVDEELVITPEEVMREHAEQAKLHAEAGLPPPTLQEVAALVRRRKLTAAFWERMRRYHHPHPHHHVTSPEHDDVFLFGITHPSWRRRHVARYSHLVLLTYRALAEALLMRQPVFKPPRILSMLSPSSLIGGDE